MDAHSSVVQARGWLPDAAGGTVWWGPHAAHATCYAPLPIGLASLCASNSDLFWIKHAKIMCTLPLDDVGLLLRIRSILAGRTATPSAINRSRVTIAHLRHLSLF